MSALKREPKWLPLEAVRALHAGQIALFGGSHGVLQRAALEAALARPVNAWHHDDGADLARLAALYLVGLVNAHAFVDGNKRVGLAAMLVFLARNAAPLKVDHVGLYAVVMSVATGELHEQDVAAWVRAHLAPWHPAGR